jgi:hypothetical protein
VITWIDADCDERIMNESLLAPTFLYRFAVPCRYVPDLAKRSPLALPDGCTLPNLSQLEGKPRLADLRMAWSEAGIGVSVKLQGKKQPPWCRDSRIEDSDGLQLWIDTRNTQNIHRAGRFCHRFAFLPTGGGRKLDEPVAALLAINRAKESPREIDPRQLRVHCDRRVDGYTLEAFLPADTLTGYNPSDQPQLGFTYALTDRELGTQTFTVGPEFPFDEDPSLWGTLELVK